jgi:hypothetical protein
LLKYALAVACNISEVSGCCVVWLDAKDEQAKQFYVKYGFEVFPIQSMRLYLTTAAARTVFDEAEKSPQGQSQGQSATPEQPPESHK